MKETNAMRFPVRFVVSCVAVSSMLALGFAARAGESSGPSNSVPPPNVSAKENPQSPAKPIDHIEDMPYRARLALMRAQDESVQGDLERAILEIRDFLKRSPDNDHFYLRNQLGNFLVQTGRQEEAVVEYQATVALEKRFTQGWLNLGEIAYNLGKYDVAANALRNGYEQSERKQANLLYFSAAAYVMAKDAASAAPLLEELVGGNFGRPKLEWFRALIAAYSDLKDADRGGKAVELLCKVYADDADAWYLAFQFYAGMGDYEHAASALKVADCIRPLTRQQAIQLGDVFAAIKVPALASSYYERAFKDSTGSSRDFEKLASAYLASYNLNAASRTITEGLEIGPTYRLWSLLGDTRFTQLDYAAALDAYRECAKLDSTQGRPFLMMAYCAIRSDRMADAIPYLERASEFPDQKVTAEQLLKKARAAASAEAPEPQKPEEPEDQQARAESH
jgi:tetratricopeptide (TPR) repeat protein